MVILEIGSLKLFARVDVKPQSSYFSAFQMIGLQAWSCYSTFKSTICICFFNHICFFLM
jgi:hypothetical protein